MQDVLLSLSKVMKITPHGLRKFMREVSLMILLRSGFINQQEVAQIPRPCGIVLRLSDILEDTVPMSMETMIL